MQSNFDARSVFSRHMRLGIAFQRAAVPELILCVTFGAFRFGAKFQNFCICFEYVTSSTISARLVREITKCEAFGGPHFVFSGATWGQPAVDEVCGVSYGTDFGICGVIVSLTVALRRIETILVGCVVARRVCCRSAVLSRLLCGMGKSLEWPIDV